MNKASVAMLCFGLFSVVVGCGLGSSQNSSISVSYASDSTESSCQQLSPSNSTCYLTLSVNNGSQNPLTLGATTNSNGAPGRLPDDYFMNGLSECSAYMNSNQGKSVNCSVQIVYEGNESQVATQLYFMLCNGFCTSQGNPLSMTSAVLLNTI